MVEKKTGRGGARKGAGRPTKPTEALTVRIESKLILKHGADKLRAAFINTANNLK